LKRSILIQIGSSDELAFEELREEVQLAEKLGLESVWCFPSAGASGDFRESAPLIWLSALASQTEKIRLGWGLAEMLAPASPPIRIAEQAAALDLASKGRLDLSLLPEAELVDAADGPWDEGVRMLVDMWDQPTFSWTSNRFAVMPVDVLPKPVQRPHPPIWLAGWNAAHAKSAGTGGMAFLDLSGGEDETLLIHREAYLEARRSADPDRLVSTGTVGIAVEFAPLGQDRARLEEWEDLGFDEIIVRTRPAEGGHEEAKERIRYLAEGITQVD
jgi:alkanesulfonate monooxygenase SsuD/methylene tetrahydromethanopterin reductase-like flavin-dependent oxidoreductase (luciferase family)